MEPRQVAAAAAVSSTAGWQPVLIVQGNYYLITGLWPLVSIETFQLVTGPKTDLWLVKTVGVMIAVMALALLAAARHRLTQPPVVVLGLGSAVALTAIDIIYVTERVILPVYLLDAAAEAVLILWWCCALGRQAQALARPKPTPGLAGRDPAGAGVGR